MLFKPKDSLESGETPRSRGRLGRAVRGTAWLLIAVMVVGGIGYVVWSAFQPRRQGFVPRRDLPISVRAAMPQEKDVPVYLEGVGTVRALNSVTIKPQVEGRLLSVNFKEGQDVNKGDLLAEIDSSIYQAQLDQALAKKAQDEALLANARADLARYQQLASANAGSRQQADTQRTTVAQLEAQVKIDQATIDNARTTLSYTKIVAPISGRTGLRQVDPGNIVRASDAAGLVVITQLKPIAVQFSLPQQQLQRVNDAFAKGPLEVDVLGSDDRKAVERGTLQSIDNQVDQTTGSVRLKAQFSNDKLTLWPGQFVNIRLKVETLPDAIVVPTAAVQRGPAGPYAYVIGPGNIVSAQAITVVQQDDREAVIGSGLTTEDRVVTTGFANLSDKSRVVIGPDGDTPTPDLAPRRRFQKGKGGQGGPGFNRKNGGPGDEESKAGERRLKKFFGGRKKNPDAEENLAPGAKAPVAAGAGAKQ